MRRQLLLISLLSMPLLAQPQGAGPAASNLIERLNRMSPAERRKALDRMPPERRELLEKRINNFNNINPEIRERLKKDYEHFQQLPPEKQTEVRRILRQIADLPDERRKHVRNVVNNLRQQTPEMQQRRLASRNFQERFSEEERKLVKDALSMLPPPEPSQIEP